LGADAVCTMAGKCRTDSGYSVGYSVSANQQMTVFSMRNLAASH
jgi:hypothetical protein